ncbi:MAG: tetratricopeptide repeat protein [Candidatus Hydrogenedentes bacterium]|nr:tetratricopeptide repeat protein [Candidatus Hydrogenedentota bacterium]
MATMIKCPYCDKLTDPKLDSCVHCGGFLRKQPAKQQQRASASASSQTCPSCGALVRDGDIICVACGTNLLTGQKIAQEQQRAVRTPDNPALRNALIAAAIAVVIIGAVAAFILTRDPVAKAQRLAADGRVTEATDLLVKYLAKHADDARGHLVLGKLYWGSSDYSNAAESLEKAAQLNPTDRDAGILAVIGMQQRADNKTRDRQIAILENVAKAHPDDDEVLYLLALAKGTKDSSESQIESLRRVADKAPESTDRRLALAVSMAIQKDEAGAQRELEAARSQAPDDPNIKAALGILAAKQGNVDDAVARLTEAIEGKTSIHKEALAQAGLLLVSQGQYGQAVALLGEAIDAGETSPSTKFFHAVCLAKQRVYEPALKAFDELARGSNEYSARAAIHAARVYLSQENAERALESLNAVTVKLSGTEGAELETVRGRGLAKAGDPDGAMDAFRKAIQQDPNYAPAHLETGLLLVQRRAIAEGIRELESYLSSADPNDAESGAREIQALVDQLKQSAQARPSTAALARNEMQGSTS